MHVVRLSGMSFPLRNSAHAFFAVLSLLTLNGCAISKGFLAGAIGGIPYVDECRHDEARHGTAHTELKVFGHQTVVVWASYGLWPLAAAYGSASAVYGAYQFWKMDREFNRTAAERTEAQKANTEKIQGSHE